MRQTVSLSQRATQWSALPTAALHGQVIALQKAGRDIIDLTIGISNLPLPSAGRDAAIQAISDNQVPYTAIGGTIELKQAIQKKLSRQNGTTADLSQIVVSTGAKQVIFQTLYALTNPGDEIMLFQPGWAAYTQIAAMLGLQTKFIGLDDITHLSKMSVSPNLKFIIFNNPHNPTGHVFSREELVALVAFARRHNLYILSDESYEELVYDGQFISAATIEGVDADHLISVFSASQSFSMMGWRLGYAVANPDIITAIEAVQSAITAGASAVTQTAVAAILNDNPQAYDAQLVREFKQRRDATFARLQAIPQLSLHLPAGGPYFWIDISQIADNSLDFCAKLLDQQSLALMPGEAFGSPGHVRMAFNIESTERLEQAVRQLADFVNNWAAGK